MRDFHKVVEDPVEGQGDFVDLVLVGLVLVPVVGARFAVELYNLLNQRYF
jgi:hypothetical protein